jgi:hypothetical protein
MISAPTHADGIRTFAMGFVHCRCVPTLRKREIESDGFELSVAIPSSLFLCSSLSFSSHDVIARRFLINTPLSPLFSPHPSQTCHHSHWTISISLPPHPLNHPLNFLME